MNQDEHFFQEIDDSLSDLFDAELNENELEAAYPIQNEIKKLSEHYSIISELDQGGMKKIKKALDLRAQRTVAFAQLKKESSAENIEQFLREARLTASLQHPNIITIYDIAIDEEGSPYFTMELLEGQTLKQHVQSNTNESILETFLKICDAIAYAHNRGILHLDLKPENIYIGSFGQVTVCDWGIARILNQDEDAEISDAPDPDILNHMTLQGQIKGTPGYMAPEQTKSYGHKDFKTDIYALGAILYFMISGKAPIQGEEVTTLIQKTQLGDIPQLHDRLLPKALKAILKKCLANKPDERYESVHQVQDDIHKYRQGFATLAEDASLWIHFRLMIKRHKKALSVFCFIIFIAALGTAVSLERIREERNLALAAEVKAEAEKEKAEFQKIEAEENLNRFIKATKENEVLRNDIIQLSHEIAQSDDLSGAKRKIAFLDEALKKEINNTKRNKIIRKKALLHFVIQEFNAANQEFEKLNNNGLQNKIHQISKDAAQLKSDKVGLSDQQLSDLLRNFSPGQSELINAMYQKHMEFIRDKGTPPTEYIPLAKTMIHFYNNIWDKDRLNNYELMIGDTVNLKGLPVNRFIIKEHDLNILKPLKFHSLDLSYTAFFEFIQIVDLNFSTINISGCRMNEITQKRIVMLKKSGIETVIYNPFFLKESEVTLLKDNFNTIEEK